MRRLLGFLLTLLLGLPAQAVVLASGDGMGNTAAPEDDPGWANVGVMVSGGRTAVYLGHGWVLTANHVGAGNVRFDDTTYKVIPQSKVRFDTGSGNPSEVIVFRIWGEPALPVLKIAASTARVGGEVVLIGNGRNRGAPTVWNEIRGWNAGPGARMRWGTNRVELGGLDIAIRGSVTRSFVTTFSQDGATEHEAQAATGDSGGAAFVKNGSTWELAGLLFAVSSLDGQPRDTILFGNVTLIADLSFYRDEILALFGAPGGDKRLEGDDDDRSNPPADAGWDVAPGGHAELLTAPGPAGRSAPLGAQDSVDRSVVNRAAARSPTRNPPHMCKNTAKCSPSEWIRHEKTQEPACVRLAPTEGWPGRSRHVLAGCGT